MQIFIFDNLNNKLKIDEYTILLIKEFAVLWDINRNKCKEDKSGEKRLKAHKEFTYIYLTLDFKSPYFKYLEKEKHDAAIVDSGLTETELKDKDFVAAYKKYEDILYKDPYLDLLKTAYHTLHKTKVFLDNLDFNTDVDDQGRPLFKPKEVMDTIGSIGKLHDTLENLEESYKINLEEKHKTRGDAETGYDEM